MCTDIHIDINIHIYMPRTKINFSPTQIYLSFTIRLPYCDRTYTCFLVYPAECPKLRLTEAVSRRSAGNIASRMNTLKSVMLGLQGNSGISNLRLVFPGLVKFTLSRLSLGYKYKLNLKYIVRGSKGKDIHQVYLMRENIDIYCNKQSAHFSIKMKISGLKGMYESFLGKSKAESILFYRFMLCASYCENNISVVYSEPVFQSF